ncbi:hypothetical protein SDC9_193565 [bioreactor metagenome]|uniref:Uncharacterized protein n=1 Tax=bioreactor metagenome TaxID=1076179 RepID=A0A645I530_9ZZZZ
MNGCAIFEVTWGLVDMPPISNIATHFALSVTALAIKALQTFPLNFGIRIFTWRISEDNIFDLLACSNSSCWKTVSGVTLEIDRDNENFYIARLIGFTLIHRRCADLIEGCFILSLIDLKKVIGRFGLTTA